MLTRSAAVLCLATAAIAQTTPPTFPPDHLLVTANDGRVSEYTADGTLVGQTLLLAEGSDHLRGPTIGPDGYLYTCNYQDGEVDAWDANGNLVATYDAGGAWTNAANVTFGPDGLMYVSDPGENAVWVVDADDTVVRQIGDVDTLPIPEGVTFGPDGLLYVTNFVGDIEVFDRNGEHLRSMTPAINSIDVAFHPDGSLLVLNISAGIWKLDANGVTIGQFANVSGLGMTWGPDGNLWVATAPGQSAVVLDVDGALVDTHDDPGAFSFGVAATPWRLRAKVRGLGGADDTGLTRVKDTDAVLSLWPGSGEVMVDWDDDGELAALVGGAAWVMRGFVQTDGEAGKRRLWTAWQPGRSWKDGPASIALQVRGKPLDDGTFAIKKVSGTLETSSRGAAAQAKLKTSGLAK